MANTPITPESKHELILKKPSVLNMVGMSAPTLWRRVKDKSFPQPISLGGRSVGWLQSEVNEWIKTRVDLRNQSAVASAKGVQS
jgi:prophage regulatory protein